MNATLRTARWIGLTALLVYTLSGGGRIVGSDEVTMLEVARALLRGQVAVPEGATLQGDDGRSYSKNAAGQAVLALPLVAGAELAARVVGLDAARRELAVRFKVSFFNALVTAVLLAVFYAGTRRLGVGAGAALAATLMLGFATPLWVYSKSFMAEPLQSLGLLLALLGASDAGGSRRAPWLAAAGALLAISVKLSMLPLALVCLVPFVADGWRRARIPALGVAVALLGHGVYNLARFGTPFESGYGAQAMPSAYSTPLLAGLYGLLISSGKGVLWFAPPLWLVPRGFRAMLERSRGRSEAPPERSVSSSDLWARLGLRAAPGRAAWSAAVTALVALLLYARFQHWAGDGSFGPRYLVPVLPLAFVVVAFALTFRPGRALRTAAAALAVLGVLVQIGGVAVYFGVQMREAGDYPYTRALDDPRFMTDSHFNPRYTPIVAHWRLLCRNLGEHLDGKAPVIGAGRASAVAGDRVVVSGEEQQALLKALDFWWLYLGYAGLPRAPVVAVVVVLLALALWAAGGTRRAWRGEVMS